MAAINKILKRANQKLSEEGSASKQPPPTHSYDWIPEYNRETWLENSVAVWPDNPNLKR